MTVTSEDINALAKEKVEISLKLEAFAMMNAFNLSVDDLTKVEIKRIELRKRLYEVSQKIENYIKGDA